MHVHDRRKAMPRETKTSSTRGWSSWIVRRVGKRVRWRDIEWSQVKRGWVMRNHLPRIGHLPVFLEFCHSACLAVFWAFWHLCLEGFLRVDVADGPSLLGRTGYRGGVWVRFGGHRRCGVRLDRYGVGFSRYAAWGWARMILLVRRVLAGGGQVLCDGGVRKYARTKWGRRCESEAVG